MVHERISASVHRSGAEFEPSAVQIHTVLAVLQIDPRLPLAARVPLDR